MRINKESCREALEVMLETYTVWHDAREKASLLPVIAVLAIGAGQDGLDVPIDDAWDEQISLTPEGEAALLADVLYEPEAVCYNGGGTLAITRVRLLNKGGTPAWVSIQSGKVVLLKLEVQGNDVTDWSPGLPMLARSGVIVTCETPGASVVVDVYGTVAEDQSNTVFSRSMELTTPPLAITEGWAWPRTPHSSWKRSLVLLGAKEGAFCGSRLPRSPGATVSLT